MLIYQAINGLACVGGPLRLTIKDIQRTHLRIWHDQILTPQTITSPLVKHIHREHNGEADSLAGRAMASRAPLFSGKRGLMM